MKATYNEKTKKFNLIYKDEVKAFKGEPRPYARYQEGWKGEKKPTKKQIEQKINELLKYGRKCEAEGKEEVERLKQKHQTKKNEGINISLWLEGLKVENITKTTTPSTVKQYKTVINWVKKYFDEEAPEATFNKFGERSVKKFCEYIAPLADGTKNFRWSIISRIFDHAGETLADKIKDFKNEFKNRHYSDYLEPQEIFTKDAFTVKDMNAMIKNFLTDATITEERRTDLICLIYFLSVTGWRVGDILTMKWSDINLEARALTMLHEKTKKKTGQMTVLYISNLMKRVFQILKKDNDTEYVFKRVAKGISVTNLINKISGFIRDFARTLPSYRAKNNAKGHKQGSLSTHSIRHTVTTELTLDNTNIILMQYYIGHSQSSTAGKHYTSFRANPERATRALLEKFENAFNWDLYITALTHGVEVLETNFGGVPLVDNWRDDLLNSGFWREDAVKHLEERYIMGSPSKTIRDIIEKAEKLRFILGEKQITADFLTSGVFGRYQANSN